MSPTRSQSTCVGFVLLLGLAAAGVVPPDRQGAEWETAAPEAFGFGREPLDAMTAALRRGDLPNVHAVLIAKDGVLVYEEYFEGTDLRYRGGERVRVSTNFEADTLHDLRSITKSVVSALAGAAVASGAIDSIDRPVVTLFPELNERVASGVDAVTVRDALMMAGGLDWNEGSVPYTDPANHDERKSHSPDPVGFVLSRPLAVEPGTVWKYNGGLPTVLGFVVARASGQPLGAFARERLFTPLGITRVEWAGPEAWGNLPEMQWQGGEEWARVSNPSSSLWLCARDLLRFGQLYADGGVWRGRRILEAEWVASSLAPALPRNEGTYELSGGWLDERAYGYYWYHDRYTLPYGEVTVHSADGNGGQKIWIVPQLGLTVVHLAGNYNQRGNAWNADRVLLEHILPWAFGVEPSYRHVGSRPVRLVERGEQPLTPLTPGALARYVGSFEEPGGVSVEVVDIGSRLQLVPPTESDEAPIDLIPLGDHTFLTGLVERGEVRRIYWPRSRLVFSLDEQGSVTGYEVREPGVETFVASRVR